MTTKEEKEGMSSQMMIIMDEMFRHECGASYEDIILTYVRRKIDSSIKSFSDLDFKRQNKFLREARKACHNLSSRLKTKGLSLVEDKKRKYLNDNRCHKVFKYPSTIADFDPIEDLRYKFKKMKLSELSGLMEQSAGLFPKSWLMNFTTQIDAYNNEVSEDQRIHKIIFFDSNEKLKNIHLLPTIVTMIREKHVIRFNYHANGGKRILVTLHPQILKEYNLRWFVVGLTMDKEKNFRNSVYALDRMDLEISIADDIQYVNSNTDYSQYFKEVVGVSVPNDKGIYDVEIIANDPMALEYIKTKPIHHSQVIIGNNLYFHLKLNYEFETRLFEFADRITILKPIELRNRIVSRANEIIKYNKE